MTFWHVAVLVALLAAGCVAPSDGGADKGSRTPEDCEPTAPKGSTTIGGPQQGAVSNNPGSFSYGGQAAGKSGTEEFAWQNPSSSARVSWGGQSATGSVQLTLLDACGDTTYSASYSGQQGGYKDVTGGEPGQWLVRLEFTAFAGQMGLSITS